MFTSDKCAHSTMRKGVIKDDWFITEYCLGCGLMLKTVRRVPVVITHSPAWRPSDKG